MTDDIRAKKREEVAKRKDNDAQIQAAIDARNGVHATISVPEGRIVVGRSISIPCPLFPEVTDPDGTVHPQLVVTFRTDQRRKMLETKVVIEALSTVEHTEGESDEDLEARRVERAAHLTVGEWCRRLQVRVISFEGWDFVDSDTRQPIPKPNPLDANSYQALVMASSDLLDLGVWLINEGFQTALGTSAKNS